MEKSDPLLLLDNGTLAYILGDGEYRFTNLKFDEAKAIIEMKGEAEEEVVQVFRNPELEKVMYAYLGLEEMKFNYEPEAHLHVGQDAIAFKLYVTPSGTQPIVLGEEGQQAVKIKNLYIYCQHIVRTK